MHLYGKTLHLLASPVKRACYEGSFGHSRVIPNPSSHASYDGQPIAVPANVSHTKRSQLKEKSPNAHALQTTTQLQNENRKQPGALYPSHLSALHKVHFGRFRRTFYKHPKQDRVLYSPVVDTKEFSASVGNSVVKNEGPASPRVSLIGR